MDNKNSPVQGDSLPPRQAGASGGKKISLKILDMHCASCAISITKYLQKQKGIMSADVNFASKKAMVEFDESIVNEEMIKKYINETGYKVASDFHEDMEHVDHEDMEDHASHISGDERKLKRIVILSIIFTLPIFVRMVWAWGLPGEYLGVSSVTWVQLVLATIIVFVFGWQFHVSAYKQLKKFSTNMYSLISLGTMAAYFYSIWAMFWGEHIYFESAATITTLILLGKYLELKTQNRASKAMEKLMELGVKQARLVESDGAQRNININEVSIGDILLVKPGEKVPLDGAIIEGQSNIDESMLTGESLPVFKKENSKVFGATINKDSVIKIKVTQVGEGTMLAQIIKTVEEAQRFKPPIQRLADKIASIFVPVVISVSVLTFIGWYLGTGDISIALINAVAVLIISCPCALGIATPIAVMVGTSAGTQKGILIKDGESFEKAKTIDVVIFDKTGTLTKGEPVVEEIIENDFEKEKIIKIAASLSSNSEHPLSKAVIKKAKEEKIKLVAVESFKEISGQGLIGNCKEHKTRILLGNKKLMKENKIETDWSEKLMEDRKNFGGTTLFVAHGNKVIGAILIADKIKEDSKKTIQEIKDMGLETIMISGDNENTAKAVSKKLGIDNYLAEVLPGKKQEEVKKLQKQGKKVIFVGDGINDAPALIQADLGIAMGGGTDIAKEAGNIIIMKNDISKVIDAIKLSRKTFKVIKQNLFWAFFYNVVAIPLAIAGFVNPMIGALAMTFSDVTVIGNSLRIYKK